MGISLAEIMEYRRTLMPAYGGPFMDMIAEVQRCLAAGHSLDAVKADIAKQASDDASPRGMFVRNLCAATLTFLERHA